MRKLMKIVVLSFVLSFIFVSYSVRAEDLKENIPPLVDVNLVFTDAILVNDTTTIEDYRISEEEIGLIALVTMAEAEGECEEGKRLVIDTILNRVDSGRFPDTIHEVIYQPHQFSSMWNGRVNRCEVREDICELVKEELIFRTNSEVVFFTAGRYGRYGVPLFRVEHHYFSKEDDEL